VGQKPRLRDGLTQLFGRSRDRGAWYLILGATDKGLQHSAVSTLCATQGAENTPDKLFNLSRNALAEEKS